MVLLDLADNSWMPLFIVFVTLGIGALLFWSMSRHIRTIDVPADHEARAASADDSADKA